MVIRPVKHNELAQLLEIEEMSYEFPWTLKDFRYAPMMTLVIEANEDIIGYICFVDNGFDKEVLNIAVHPAFRRRGYGTELLLTVIKCLGLYEGVGLQVPEGNKAAHCFF